MRPEALQPRDGLDTALLSVTNAHYSNPVTYQQSSQIFMPESVVLSRDVKFPLALKLLLEPGLSGGSGNKWWALSSPAGLSGYWGAMANFNEWSRIP